MHIMLTRMRLLSPQMQRFRDVYFASLFRLTDCTTISLNNTAAIPVLVYCGI